MVRQRQIVINSALFLAFAVLLTGCCSTCSSLSGRHSEMPMPSDSSVVSSMTRLVTPKRLEGSLKRKMEERGVLSGCGEFFWSSWFNDGPDKVADSWGEPDVEENFLTLPRRILPQRILPGSILPGVILSKDVPTRSVLPSSKAAHRVTESHRPVRMASTELDNEI